ncbi:hypothetical protein H2200_009722 [Cladophialophora chaetospira]|uniref:Uncharacterized protein n=1 Tax=Cladophialophora chaetospira TaxID=386627 RepID=A0AA39CEZ9_9EURO|nr:hypothetical protein H2200_009722 [Cladophialophora chaetospira]
MDENNYPPPPRFHSFVKTLKNVRTATERLQEGVVRAPGDEGRLPGRVNRPFIASDHLSNNGFHNNATGAANEYFGTHPDAHLGKTVEFFLKSNPRVVMQGIIVSTENDQILNLRDVIVRDTLQRVSQTTYYEDDIEIVPKNTAGQSVSPSSFIAPALPHTDSGFNPPPLPHTSSSFGSPPASQMGIGSSSPPSFQTGIGSSSPPSFPIGIGSSPPQTFHTGSGFFSPGSVYTSPHASMSGSPPTPRCGRCRLPIRSVSFHLLG